MNVVIKSEPKDMDSEELAKCLEAGADYKLYAASPMRAYMHGIDMEHWLRASADRIRTLTAEVERLRHENVQRMTNENEATAIYCRFIYDGKDPIGALHKIALVLTRPIETYEASRAALGIGGGE